MSKCCVDGGEYGNKNSSSSWVVCIWTKSSIYWIQILFKNIPDEPPCYIHRILLWAC
jgi:hypothetical protein